MNEPETPIRKVSRPCTRMSTRGRSNSLGSHPSSPNQIRTYSPLAEVPVMAPVINMDVLQNIRNVDPVVIPTVDAGNAESQTQRDNEPAAPPTAQPPRDEHQQSRGVDPGTRTPTLLVQTTMLEVTLPLMPLLHLVILPEWIPNSRPTGS